MRNHNKEINRLISDIKALLSKDRCPLNDEEKALLEKSIAALKTQNKPIDLKTVGQVVDFILMAFKAVDTVKDFLF